MNNMKRTAKVGLGALLTPDNCALILMDHQPFQFTSLGSHDSQAVKNNVVGWRRPRRPSASPRC